MLIFAKLTKFATAALLLTWGGLARSETALEWPGWRGPHGDGSAVAGEYPLQWDTEKNVVWKADLPGKGCSTPAVAHEKIFLTAPVDGMDAALAFDWDGKALWRTMLGPGTAGKADNGSGCNPSPATDGKALFVTFKSGTLAALDLKGKVKWRTNLVERYGEDNRYWDYGTSPVLTDADVVIAELRSGNSYVAAFSKETGELHWKTARNFETPVEGDQSYATPLVARQNGKEIVLVWGGEHLTAQDSENGQTLWTCGNFNPKRAPNWVAVCSPVLAGNMAIVPFGRGNRTHGIKIDGGGEAPAGQRIWERTDTGTFVPTPAGDGQKVYLVRDRGEVECIDPATGKTEWSGRLPKSGASYYSSPIVAGGNLYAAREDGVVFAARLEPTLDILGENKMGEKIIASPVAVANRLLLRGEKHLFCIGRGTQ